MHTVVRLVRTNGATPGGKKVTANACPVSLHALSGETSSTKGVTPDDQKCLSAIQKIRHGSMTPQAHLTAQVACGKIEPKVVL